MSDVVNKAPPDGDPAFAPFFTLLAANTPDFPPGQWVRNSPNLPALIGTGSPDNPQAPKRYWIVDPPTSQNLREMTAPEKAIVDGAPAELAAARATKRVELHAAATAYVGSRYSADLQLIFQQAQPVATGTRGVELSAWFAWLTTVYSATKAGEVAVNAAASVPAIEAVSVSYATFDGTDPLTLLTDVVP
jgi:hypothetical protein